MLSKLFSLGMDQSSSDSTAYEALPSEVDYFDQDVVQTSITDEFDRDFIPLSSITGDGPIEFFVRGADNLLLDLNNSKIEIKVRIVRANGDICTDADHVGPVNLILHSLFSHVEVELCGKSFGDPNNLYAYRAYLETLLNNSPDVLDSRLKCEGWEKDTADNMDSTDPDEATAADQNKGLMTRSVDFKKSKTVTLMGRPHHELFRQEKDIPPNCDLKVRLIRNRSAFCLMAKKVTGDATALANATRYKFEIKAAKLWIRTKTLANHVALAFEKLLQKSNMRLRPNKNVMKHVSIPKGVSCFELDNVFMGQLPDRLFMCMVADESMSGSQWLNPFDFQNFNVSQIGVKVNSESIPRQPLSLVFPPSESEDFTRGYITLLSALGVDEGEKAIDITADEWSGGFTIYGFKITPGPIGSSAGVRSLQRSGALKAEIKFAAATTVNINLIFYAEFPCSLEIDRFRNVTISSSG